MCQCANNSVQHIWAESSQGAGPTAGGNFFSPTYWFTVTSTAFPDGVQARTPPFQTSPPPTACQASEAQSFSTGGIVVGLGDGSCRIVNPGISVASWTYAIYPNDGQTLSGDW
jgi:hypothetical protein